MSGRTEASGGLRRVAFKIRSEGPGWIVKRLAAEASLPSTGPGRRLHALARSTIGLVAALPRRLQSLVVSKPADAATTLYAFYDLQVAPITFDFLWFLASADLKRRALGLEAVHVVIVPGRMGGLRRERADYDEVIDADARHERIRNILLPSCSLLPSCAGVTYASSRKQAAFLRSALAEHVYPVGYEPALPVYAGPEDCFAAARRGTPSIACLRASPQRLRDVDAWAASQRGAQRIVAITLRNYDYMPARNSAMGAWIAFARTLDRARFMPVFVPDLNQTLNAQARDLDGLPVLGEATWNVGLRMALYERAFVCLGVNTGPMGLCWLNARTHYATLKMAPANVPQTALDYFRELGFEPGRSLPFAAPTQELVWEDDTQDAITRAFNRIAARLEQDRF